MDATIFLQALILHGFLILSHGLKAPKIKPFHFSGELRVGLRTVVLCAVIDGSPPFEFQWLKDDKPLLHERGHFSIQSVDEFTSFLTISDLNSESNGNFTCRVQGLLKSSHFHFSEELNQGMRMAVLCVVMDGDSPLNFNGSKMTALFARKRPFSCNNRMMSILPF
ncbi:titin [Caerostris extrusa]|uniref:Titin n=1 Tax=Caerostris extrusa TaxID=172846 RepID=A0AAV4TGX0_CAEEX|nr:titin [Caerostris extrusa]